MFSILKMILGVERRPSDPGAGLAAESRDATRGPIEFAPPGPKLTGLTTNDIDMDTGKPYPDYLERRRQRSAAKPEDQLAGLVGHDVRPD
jgi:hypothetical protein